MEKHDHRIARLLILGMLLLQGISAWSQNLTWFDDLKRAQEAAKKLSQPLLIYFYIPGSEPARKMEEIFEISAFKKEAAEFVLVKIDIQKNPDIASKLGVYRSGTFMAYSYSGKGLARITETESAENLIVEIRKAQGKVTNIDQLRKQLSTIVVTGPVPPPLPKGDMVTSFTLKATDSNPVNLGVLEKGTKYVLVIAGQMSIWGNQKQTSDVFYHHKRPGWDNLLSSHTFLRFRKTNQSLFDFLHSKGKTPVYNPKHVYEVSLEGDGTELVFFGHEKDARSYTDNSGEVTLTLYKAK